MKAFFKKYGIYILAPLLTTLLILVVYLLKGMYPFGSNTIIQADLGQGHIPNCYLMWYIIHGVVGESFSFNGSKNDINIIIKKLKIEILSKQDLDNIIVIEGYSPLINKSIYINNENINIQIAFNNNKITVGYPLILGSF